MGIDRKREKPFVFKQKTNGPVSEFWCIANIQSFVDGGDDCFVKEVPISAGSEYMTYEADHFIEDATLYGAKETAERLIECYHMPERVYRPLKVLFDVEYTVDPDKEFTKD